MSDRARGGQGPGVRPPHPATVVQRSPQHPATVVQRRAPHPATVVQRRPQHPATVVQRRPQHPATVAQPMDFLRGLGKGIEIVFSSIGKGVLNPFERPEYTSCLCLVFNKTNEDEVLESLGYRFILDGIKSTWKKSHAKGTFHFLCPYNSDHKLTPKWASAMDLNLGERPLIVVTGHCSPGSDHVSTDDKEPFSVQEVYNAVSPFMGMAPCSTVFLTPCSTGVPGGDNEPSFHARFDEIAREIITDRVFFTIGTTSTSVPIFGKLHAEDLTFSFKGGFIDQNQYVDLLKANSE